VSSDDRYSDYIKKIVDAAPPLTPEQRARLRELLRPWQLSGATTASRIAKHNEACAYHPDMSP
jgi:hypothetical protein